MSISFSCPSCGRQYNVNESLAGRSVRCKSCGNPVKVPTAGPIPDDADDPYGLAEEPAASSPEPEEESEAALPRKTGRQPSRARKSSARAGDSGSGSGFRKALFFVIGFGVVAYVLPMFGLVLKPRGARQGLDPDAQQQIGLAFAIIGSVLLGLTFLGQGVRSGLRSSLGEERAASIAFWTKRLLWAVPLGFVGLIVVMSILRAIFVRHNPPPPAFPQQAHQARAAAAVPNAAPPHPADPIPPGPQPTASPSPAGAPARVELSNGTVSPGQTPAGSPRPGLLVTFHFQVTEGRLEPGPSRFFWVVTSPDGRDHRLMVPLGFRRASGDFRANISNLSRDDGPFQVHMEVRSFGPPNAPGQPISNTLNLDWSDTAP